MRRRQFLGSLAAATAFAATGCSSTGTSSGGTSAGGGGQTVKLVFRQFDPPTEIAGLTKVVDSWNAANPKIQVKLETLAGTADYPQQFSREANSGSGPDVVQLGFVNVKDLAKPKILMPVSELAKKSQPETPVDKFLALDMNEFDDKTWALPWTVDTFAMAFNDDVMKASGRQVPTTWEDLRDTAAAISKGGKAAGFVFAAASSAAAGQWFAINYYMWSKGFGLVKQDGKAWVPGASADQFASAMDYFNSLFTSGATPKSFQAVEQFNDPQIVTGVATGTAAMALMAPQTLKQARSTSQKVMTDPVPDGLTDGSSHLGGRSLGINASTKNPEAAWEFVKYLNSAKAFESIPQYPAATTVLQSMKVPAAEEGYQKQLPHSRSFARYINGPVPVPTLQKLSCAAFGAVYSGQKTSAQSAKELIDAIAAAIKA